MAAPRSSNSVNKRRRVFATQTLEDRIVEAGGLSARQVHRLRTRKRIHPNSALARALRQGDLPPGSFREL